MGIGNLLRGLVQTLKNITGITTWEQVNAWKAELDELFFQQSSLISDNWGKFRADDAPLSILLTYAKAKAIQKLVDQCITKIEAFKDGKVKLDVTKQKQMFIAIYYSFEHLLNEGEIEKAVSGVIAEESSSKAYLVDVLVRRIASFIDYNTVENDSLYGDLFNNWIVFSSNGQVPTGLRVELKMLEYAVEIFVDKLYEELERRGKLVSSEA